MISLAIESILGISVGIFILLPILSIALMISCGVVFGYFVLRTSLLIIGRFIPFIGYKTGMTSSRSTSSFTRESPRMKPILMEPINDSESKETQTKLSTSSMEDYGYYGEK